MDTQPVRNLTVYGYRKPTTPNLERIAREALVYDNHFVTGCWTVPSHASLFTGKYQTGHATGVQYEFMSDAFPTMAEVLSGEGYQTVAFSNNTWV
ncbi:MAG: sulfatase-like hydrolase/transferase, partial [Gammaproteobacteria bacterium]